MKTPDAYCISPSLTERSIQALARAFCVLLILCFAHSTLCNNTLAQGTTFTYQGRLSDDGGPADGLYDLAFVVYESPTGGGALGGFTNPAVGVSAGLFTVTLDFGAGLFDGDARWMEIGVRTNSTGSFSALSPRQPITATPYAIFALDAATAESMPAANLTGTVPASALPSTVAYSDQPQEFSEIIRFTGPVEFDVVGGPPFAVVSGVDMVTGLNAELLGGRTAQGFWKTSGNSGTTPGVDVLGTRDNQPLHLAVDNAAALRLEPTAGTPNVIGGHTANQASGVAGAVIGGGGGLNEPNLVSADLGTISGGLENQVQGLLGAVGGGQANVSAGVASFVGGGAGNLAHDEFTVLGGGFLNQVGGSNSVVAGGYQNVAQAPVATVAGGRHNVAGAVGDAVGGGSVNQAVGGYSVVSGGEGNTASGYHAVVGGGWQTKATNSYATAAGGAWNIAGGPGAFVGGGGWDGVEVGGNVAEGPAATIGGGLQNSIHETGYGAVISGGLRNTLLEGAEGSVIGGGAHHFMNSGARYSTIAGGRSNRVDAADMGVIAGGELNRLESPGNHGVIGGGHHNSIDESGSVVIGGGGHHEIGSGSSYATIAGGFSNRIDAAGMGVIAGGELNRLGGGARRAVIGGGSSNTIADGGAYSVLVGGAENDISGSGYGFVGGGLSNSVGGGATRAVIGGGENNSAYGAYSMIPGGIGNWTDEGYTFAAGRGARAMDEGSFVWADSTDANFSSQRADEFAVRANGGVRIDSGTSAGIALNAANRPMLTRLYDPFTGGTHWGAGRWGLFMEPHALVLGMPSLSNKTVQMAKYNADSTRTTLMILDQAGNMSIAGTYSPSSDRNAKENIREIDPDEVLEKVAAMPVSRWNFKQDPEADHVGPMAQDFHAAFGLGTDDRHITTVDADGVALAAIQGLNAKLEEKNAEIARLEERLNALERLVRVRSGGPQGNVPAARRTAQTTTLAAMRVRPKTGKAFDSIAGAERRQAATAAATVNATKPRTTTGPSG